MKKEIVALRKALKLKKIDYYIIPTADYHESEYVSAYFQFRKYLSGFTGSAGVLVVSQKEACLWTDGRYFIQASKQLAGSGIKLMKMGVAQVPTIEEYLANRLTKGMTLGFDGRCISIQAGNKYANIAKNCKAKINYQADLAEMVWKNRPAMPDSPIWILEEKWTGESRESKLARVREKLAALGAKVQLLTSLDDIAWLLNIRGNDVKNNPVVLAYALISVTKVDLYLDLKKVSVEVKKELGKNIRLHNYFDIYQDIKQLSSTIQMDPTKVNYTLYQSANVKIIEAENPELMMKAIKNKVELANLRKAHLYDGIALTKFIYWLKKTVKTTEITEWDATEYLEKLRRSNKNCLDLSFGSIGAYNENAAMMHYSATKNNAATLKPQGLYLIDSGGQYYQGTTDVTRTVVLGSLPSAWKRDYTLTLKGHIRLAACKFLYGCRGTNLDILCRGPLWNEGIDYKCGTGHGIGYLLNVHEAPNGFRWQIVPERNDSCVLEEGMVTSDEPGVYTEGSHGIRIESELVCHKAQANYYGQFMEFEVITLAPIDVQGIDVTLLSDDELRYLNKYHAMVYRKLAKYMTVEERKWLKKVTAALKR